MGKVKKITKKNEADESLDDSQPSEAETNKEDEDLDAQEYTIDNDELSDILDAMEMDQTADIKVRPSDEDEDEESTQELLRNSERIVRRVSSSRARKSTVSTIERDQEEDRRPMSRWLLSTCRYCGNMYRFRSDQPKPFTCERPQCIAKFDENKKNS